MLATDHISGLTHERLKALLCYEPLTGVFRWRVARPNGVKPGDVAGRVHADSGYRVIKVDNRAFVASRLAWFYMTGAWPIVLIDHDDLNKTNDAWSNLRPATHRQNQQNRRTQKSNTSGFKGASLRKGRNVWQANIRVAGRLHYLGCFPTPDEAHAAYVAAAQSTFGPFARTV